MSTIFEKHTKVTDAESPRWCTHSTIPTGATLSIVFDQYSLREERKSSSRKPINLFFLAGTGMTKAIWKYHINKLFEYSESNPDLSWQIINAVALDQVNHGDSAIANSGKLGWDFDWREGSFDLLQVAKSLKLPGENVLIGHSMGGFQALYATIQSPILFKFGIAIEPVTHDNPTSREVFMKKFLPALSRIIRSEFKDEEDFYTYFKTKSFYKKFHPDVLHEFLESEKIVHEDGTISAKTSKEQQMICYLAGGKILPIGREILKFVPIPIIHVVGDKATWNSKKSVNEVDETIENIQRVNIKDGLHLLNAELPDELIGVIIKGLTENIKKGTGTDAASVSNTTQSGLVFKEKYASLEKKYFTRAKSSKL